MLLGFLIGAFLMLALAITSFAAIAGSHKPTMIVFAPVEQPVVPDPVLVIPCGSIVPADDPAFMREWLEDRSLS